MDQIDKTWQGQVIVQLGTGDPSSSKLVGTLVPIFLLISEGLNYPAKYDFVARGLSSEVDQLVKLVRGGGKSLINVRVGVKTSPGSIVWRPWQSHVVATFSAEPTGIGKSESRVNVSTRDLLWNTVGSIRRESRRGTISSIVESIARSCGFTSFEIEPTVGRGAWIQRSNDLDFIVDKLIPRASNSLGSGNYRMFVKDNVFHFHTPDFKPSLKKFSYLGSNRGLSVTFEDNVQNLISSGTAGMTAVVYNPYDAASKNEKSDPSHSLKLAEYAPNTDAQKGLIFFGHHSSAANLEIQEAKNIAQHIYDTARFSRYRANVVSARTLNVSVNDLMFLDADHSNTEKSAWSGWWSVGSVKHLVKSGNVTTSFDMTRGELQGPSNEALGISPRFSKTGQSIRDESGTLFVEIIDASTQ